MKDLIVIILFYLIWNTPLHIQAHPTLIPVLFTITVIIWIIEIIVTIIDKKQK
jgi:hypothetical protein